MKLLFDFGTILLFFAAYKLYNIYYAVASVMIVYSVATAIQLIRKQTIDKIQWITLGLILVLGGATLVFHNEMIFKWKTTAVYTLFAVSFLVNHLSKKTPFIQHLLADKIMLPAPVWRQLNLSWMYYFVILATTNLYVAYHYDTDTWVKFKMFGIMGFTLIFVIGQTIFLSKHIKEEPK